MNNRYFKEQIRVRGILAHRDSWLVWSFHARERMRHDRITEADVRHVLTTGQVTWTETKVDEIFTVEGRLPGDHTKKMRVAVAVRDAAFTLKVITVIPFWKGSRQ